MTLHPDVFYDYIKPESKDSGFCLGGKMKFAHLTFVAALFVASACKPVVEENPEPPKIVDASFYIYFSNETRAQPTLAALKAKGFVVESTASAKPGEWLLLAHKSMTPEQLFTTDGDMEKMAKANGGDYDGNEVAVPK